MQKTYFKNKVYIFYFCIKVLIRQGQVQGPAPCWGNPVKGVPVHSRGLELGGI